MDALIGVCCRGYFFSLPRLRGGRKVDSSVLDILKLAN